MIVITSFASMQTAIQALRAGVKDYLIKPFEELELVTSVVRRAAKKIPLHEEKTLKEDGGRVAERIRAQIEDYLFPGKESQPDGKLTISIGVAGYPQNGANARERIECVDGALYDARKNGRNQVRMKE